MQDAGTGRHPLGGAVGDQTAAAVRILVREAAVDHVGDGFEAAMRMPVGAPGLAGLVLHLPHLIHVHEGVEVGGTHTGEGPDDREALALHPPRSGGDGADRPFGVHRGGGIHPRQVQWVCGHCGHGTSLGPDLFTRRPTCTRC